ncbi:MAG: hypothetical protein DGJ47_001181 [Rickettsiaceae bacterium]
MNDSTKKTVIEAASWVAGFTVLCAGLALSSAAVAACASMIGDTNSNREEVELLTLIGGWVVTYDASRMVHKTVEDVLSYIFLDPESENANSEMDLVGLDQSLQVDEVWHIVN